MSSLPLRDSLTGFARRERQRSSMSLLREHAFDAILLRMTDPYFPRLQQAIGVWDWDHAIPMPSEALSFCNPARGVMTLTTPLQGGEQLKIPIFVMPGDVRIGMMIPTKFITEALDEQILGVWTGGGIGYPDLVVSTRKAGAYRLFDWIFLGGPADARFMAEATVDAHLEEAFIDRLALACEHIYCATVMKLVDSGAVASVKPPIGPNEYEALCMVDGDGLPDAALDKLAGRVRILTVSKLGSTRCAILIAMDKTQTIDPADLLAPLKVQVQPLGELEQITL